MGKSVMTVAALLTAALALGGCAAQSVSGSPAAEPSSTAPGTASTTASASDAAQVEQTFRDYYQALLARDFTKACAFNAPETNAKLLENLRSSNFSAADCPDALTKIYAAPGAASVVDTVVRTSQVRDVKVTGDTATITWSAEANAARTTITSNMRKIDGQWKLVDVD